VPTLQLPANSHLAGGINAMSLKDRLGDVETDCRGRLHGSLSGSWELDSVHIRGTCVPVEEPSRPEVVNQRGKRPTGQLAWSNRLSISSRSKVKSIGLVSNPVAPPSVAIRLVSGSP